MDYIEEFLKSMVTAGRSPSTITASKGTLRRFKKVIGKKNLLAVDREDVELFILDLQKTMNAKSGIYIRLNALKIFYDFLVEDLEVLTRNPIKQKIKKIERGKVTTNRPKRTFKEVYEFIQGITRYQDKVIVALFLKTLMRNGELCALNVGDVDLVRGQVEVSKHIDWHGAGKSVPGRKNGESSTIPMDDEMIKGLRIYLKIRPNVKHDALFLSRDGTRLKPDRVRSLVDKWSNKNGFGSNGGKYSDAITPHWLRAFGTMEMEKRGIPPSIIQYIRGDVPATTMDGYSRSVLHPEDVKKEYVDRIYKFDL